MWTVLDEKYDIKYTFLDIDDNLSSEIENDIRESGDQVFRQSNAKADMTDWKSTFKSFAALEEKINQATNKECIYDNHWGLIYRDGDHAIPHNHRGRGDDDGAKVLFSFIFYVSTPEGSGELHFLENDIFVTPQKNMLITFNCQAFHQVFPNTVSGIERIITAGNVFF